MQRWHLTAGLAGAAVLAALLVPNLPGLRGGGVAPALTVAPPAPDPVPAVSPAFQGLLTLEAHLDQEAVLAGSGEDRYLVVEVSAPELAGDVRRPVNLAVVMDTSGSMAGRGKISHARMAAKELVNLMGPQDTLSLVTFSSTARVHAPSGPVVDKAWLTSVIDGIRPEGGTNLYDGIATGFSQLDQASLSGVKRVVVLSDGKANMGVSDPDELRRVAGSRVQDGISVSALGLGLDYDEDLLGRMSDAGGGRYRFVDRPGQLTELFVDELRQMTAIAGREATVDVQLPTGITLLELYGYESELRGDGFRVFLGDVHGGETRKIVARVRVASGAEGDVDIADVDLDYADAESGRLAKQQAHVAAAVTRNEVVAKRSLNKDVTKKAALARSAKLLDESARAWEKGDMASNQAKLTEAQSMLQSIGYLTGDRDLLEEAAGYADQKAAFGAAAPASAEGFYQVKKAKEASRDQSRR